MSLAVTTVCSSIAALHIDGVTIKDLDKIPPVAERLMPILFPVPNGEVSNFSATRESFGGGSSMLANVEYDLNYLFLYDKIGGGRTGLDWEKDRVTKWMDICDAILEIDTFSGGVDIWPVGSMLFSTYDDPAGNHYLGCAMTFHVIEFWR